MKGYMRRRGDAWELRVYLGADRVTGKQRYATRTVRGGKREAQRTMAQMVTEAERGLAVRTNATTAQLLEAWFEHAAPDFSPKTVKERRGFIDRNRLPALGEVPLSKLRPSGLDRLYRRLQRQGGSHGGPLAPATVRRIHGILRRALGQGVRWGWLGVNPAASTTPPRVPHSEIKPLSSADLAKVLRRATESAPELACYLVLAAATGARRSEIVALRWRGVDFDGGTVMIERGVVMGPDGLVEKDTKTHAARRADPARAHVVSVEILDRARWTTASRRSRVRSDRPGTALQRDDAGGDSGRRCRTAGKLRAYAGQRLQAAQEVNHVRQPDRDRHPVRPSAAR